MTSTKRKLGRVFVTGADGFIGSHLVERLVEEGAEVTALCIYNSMGRFGWLDELVERKPKNLQLLLGDIRDPFFMQDAVNGHQTVLHLAALIAIPYSYIAPQSYFETNTVGTVNVCNAAVKAKVERMIHTSTSEVYGTAQFVPISETHPLQGQSPYAASKIGADAAAESFYRSFDLSLMTLRPFNTYGPRQSLRAVMPTIAAQILAGKKEIRLGNIKPTRDFNYVSDTVDAFLKLAECDDKSCLGQTFNAGSGFEISIEDLVKKIASKLGADVSISEDIDRIRPDKSEVERLLADASKLKKATGYAPVVSIDQGIEKLIQWLKQNKSFLTQAEQYSR